MEHRVALSPLIAKLPARQQKILHLRFFEGLTQSEIASRLGLTEGAYEPFTGGPAALLRGQAADGRVIVRPQQDALPG